MSAIAYLDRALAGFDRDHADSDYQRGYEAALKDARAALALPPEAERVEIPAAQIAVPRPMLDALLDDYQTSEHHHPDHVLVRRDAFDRLAALAGGSVTPPEAERVEALPSHPRENVRPAYTDTMVALLDAYEQRIWTWAQGCEVDGIKQRSQIGDSYNESQREDASKARSALIRQIDALTTEQATPATPDEQPDQRAGEDYDPNAPIGTIHVTPGMDAALRRALANSTETLEKLHPSQESHNVEAKASEGRFRRFAERIADWTDAEVAVASPSQVRHVARVVRDGADPTYPPFAPTEGAPL